MSPTAAVFAHHRRAGSAGTPHGTTPPNLAAARQASLQDPLPTLDMTVRPHLYLKLLYHPKHYREFL